MTTCAQTAMIGCQAPKTGPLPRLILAAVFAIGLSGCATSNDMHAQRGTPPVSGSLMNAGDALMATGDHSGAVALYRSAHDQQPDQAEPLIRLGHALAVAGASSDAAEAFRAALDRDATNADAKRGLGNTLLSLGQPALAIPYLEDAIALSQAADGAPDWRACLGLGVALDLTGDPAGAQASYRRGLGVVPDNPDLTNNLGLSLALSGAAQEAIGLLETLSGRHGNRSRYAGTLAIAYALSGRDEEAARMMSLESPPDAVARNLLSLAAIRAMENHAQKALAIRTIYSG